MNKTNKWIPTGAIFTNPLFFLFLADGHPLIKLGVEMKLGVRHPVSRVMYLSMSGVILASVVLYHIFYGRHEQRHE